MLDLEPIKARLNAATSWTGSGDSEAMHRLAAWDIASLIAEVERLRDDNHALQAEVILTIEQMERLREAIAKHRTEYLTGSIPARDRELWAVLDA